MPFTVPPRKRKVTSSTSFALNRSKFTSPRKLRFVNDAGRIMTWPVTLKPELYPSPRSPIGIDKPPLTPNETGRGASCADTNAGNATNAARPTNRSERFMRTSKNCKRPDTSDHIAFARDFAPSLGPDESRAHGDDSLTPDTKYSVSPKQLVGTKVCCSYSTAT